ncbi:MAG: hypothetical protein WAP05_06190 [Dethiobacteria bacterium]
MKTEINLRTREFIIAREFYLPRFLATLAVIGLVVLVLGGTIFIYLYQVRLEVEHEALLQEKAALEATVAPLKEIEAKLKSLESRESLLKSLETGSPPWSVSFKKIYGIAQATGPRVAVLDTGDEELFTIEGESPSMRQVALFTQALETDLDGRLALHKYIIYPSDSKQFVYEIELAFTDGGEQ